MTSFIFFIQFKKKLHKSTMNSMINNTPINNQLQSIFYFTPQKDPIKLSSDKSTKWSDASQDQMTKICQRLTQILQTRSNKEQPLTFKNIIVMTKGKFQQIEKGYHKIYDEYKIVRELLDNKIPEDNQPKDGSNFFKKMINKFLKNNDAKNKAELSQKNYLSDLNKANQRQVRWKQIQVQNKMLQKHIVHLQERISQQKKYSDHLLKEIERQKQSSYYLDQLRSDIGYNHKKIMEEFISLKNIGEESVRLSRSYHNAFICSSDNSFIAEDQSKIIFDES